MLAGILPPFPRTPPARLPELMDRGDADPEALRDALETLSRANARFGTRRMVRRAAAPMLEGSPDRTVRVLDVGAGSGDIGASLARGLREEGLRPRLVLADLHPRTLRIARERIRDEGTVSPDALACVRLTASDLPFPDAGFDLAVSSTMLHHLERREAVRFLREMHRVSGGRWVITDLRRSRTAYLAIRLLAATLWRRHPYPRRDGPISVRRAFTAREARELLASADVPGAEVAPAFPFRLRIRGPAGGPGP